MRAVHKRRSISHAKHGFFESDFDVHHLNIGRRCLVVEQGHHNRCNALAVITVCVLAAAEKAGKDFEFFLRRFGSQLVVALRKPQDIVAPRSCAHHGRAYDLVVGTALAPLAAHSRDALRSQDRRNLANKCGTINGVESPSTMVDGIGNVIVAGRLRSVLISSLLLVAVVVATDGRH